MHYPHAWQLVDCAELYNTAAAKAALRQFASFFSPAIVTAYTSVRALIEASEAQQASSSAANVLVACDAGTDVSRGFKRTASAVLCEGGLAFTLINGGEAGVTMRGWRRLAGAAPGEVDAPPWPAPQVDAVLRIEELDLRAGPARSARRMEPPAFLNDCDGGVEGEDF